LTSLPLRRQKAWGYTVVEMQDSISIEDTIESLRLRIEAVAQRAGRKASEIELMAVTKFQPVEAVRAAYTAGIRIFGENRVQEASTKFGGNLRSELPDARLDMIGQLQRNKINKALEVFDSIQSIGSMDILDAVLERFGAGRNLLHLYLELHTGEDTKSGFPDLDGLLRAVERFLEKTSPGGKARLRGLMTMAPFTDDHSAQRRAFRSLAGAAEAIRSRFSIEGFGDLSMGMSSDFEVAIEEGATMIRIGTAIFGSRGNTP
jgi:PLP dependent protein